jgi:hypothetical protein
LKTTHKCFQEKKPTSVLKLLGSCCTAVRQDENKREMEVGCWWDQSGTLVERDASVQPWEGTAWKLLQST